MDTTLNIEHIHERKKTYKTNKGQGFFGLDKREKTQKKYIKSNI